MKAKPDCTGKRFGRLLVIGVGSRKPDRRNSFIQLWKLQCDCGNIIEKPRWDFESLKQISCGCARRLGLVDNKRRPKDIAGQKFGQLTAIALTGKKDKSKKPVWLLQCDCGGTREMSLTLIKHYQRSHIRLNCRDKSKHLDRYLEYPATPSPYPRDAGQLLEKYLHFTELNYQQAAFCTGYFPRKDALIDSAIEDEKRDRLLRAAWIITYRRQQGEQISELHEKRIISKHLRYCSIDIFWKRKLESQGGLLYNVAGKKKEIGNTMTNLTSHDYPAIETQGNITLSTNNLLSKRLKFQRR